MIYIYNICIYIYRERDFVLHYTFLCTIYVSILETSSSSSSSDEDQTPRRRSYDLRVHKPRTELYKAPVNGRNFKIVVLIFFFSE